MNAITDLRDAIRSLDHVPNETPVELTLAHGAPNAVAYDEREGVVRISIGIGSASARPTMGQLRAWLYLPETMASEVVAPPPEPSLQGPWSIARGIEMPSWRSILIGLSAIASGYHGARRNGGSIFWGLIWFTAGALFPVVTPTIAVAQGYGRCASNCYIAPTERR